MSDPSRPATRPGNPLFSTGPCAKHPGWSFQNLQDAQLGRSHRAAPARARLREVLALSREILRLPDDYRIGIVPASDTGAFEMAMWSVLGARGVDVLAWESFGKGWVTDVIKQLKLDEARILEADYGLLPDLAAVEPDRDVVFTWNGTTSGVRVPDAEWIDADRTGLTLCDATSAAFAQELDWSKLDVTTYSWQKVLGGEAQHGMLILSPRAVERLESYAPPWPLPKIFRLTKGGKLIEDIFDGATINTPSMLCVEDHLAALHWARDIGGLDALIARADANAAALSAWVEATPWIDFVAQDPATRSNTSVCLRFTAPEVAGLAKDQRSAFAKSVVAALDAEGVAYDIGGHRDAPPGLRIWCGSTVETADIEALRPWIEWAYDGALNSLRAAA